MDECGKYRGGRAGAALTASAPSAKLRDQRIAGIAVCGGWTACPGRAVAERCGARKAGFRCGPRESGNCVFETGADDGRGARAGAGSQTESCEPGHAGSFGANVDAVKGTGESGVSV